MDYDDNDVQDQNLNLAGEGSSKVSPVLHSYPLPKFDFGENLQEHLGFDSLVENEVFLGITSQEDNQWIEEYSRETSAIPFTSSAPESRHQNVWSEATSSESVEMLLKSVGQEEKVLEETMIEELDPNLKQCDENDANEVADCEQSHVTFTSQSSDEEKVDKISNQEGSNLENPSVSKVECENASIEECQENTQEVLEKLNENASDVIHDDTNQEGSNLVKESFVNELQEDLSVKNVDVSVDENLQTVDKTINEEASELSKNLDSSELEHVEKIHDDANENGSNLVNESFVNELQENPSVTKVECGNATFEETPQEVSQTLNENVSDLSQNFDSSEPEHKDDAKEDGSFLVNESFVNELQEDHSVTKIESGNASFEETPQEVSQTLDENVSDVSKNFDSSEPVLDDEICDDANEGGSNSVKESFVDELEEDPSLSKVKNVDASLDDSQENENASDLSKNFHSSELDDVDKIHDDANEDDSKLANESYDNELQVNVSASASMVETGNASCIHTVDASVDECQKNPQEVSETCNETASDKSKNFDQMHDDAPQEGCNLGNESFDNELQENPSDEMHTEDIINKDEAAVNNTPDKIYGLEKVVDEIETQSLDPDTESMDQDSTFDERGNSRLPLGSKDMKMDVVGIPDGEKNLEPSLSENNAPDIDTVDSNQSTPVNISCLDQSSEPNAVSMDQDFTFSEKGDSSLHLDSKDMEMDVDKAPESQKNVEPSSSVVIAQGSDAVAVVESSKVTEDQPRSPILGVSLLHDDKEEKVEVGPSIDGSFQKETPEVDSKVPDDAEKGSYSNVGPTEQITDHKEEANNVLLDHKDSMTGEHGVEPLNLSVNISVGGQSEHVKTNEDGSVSMDKFQVFSFSGTKSIELEPSQSEKDKGTVENSSLFTKMSNEAVSLSTPTKEVNSFTFENLKVSTVSSSGIVLDTNKPHENSPVTTQTTSVTPSESGAKKKSERKPRRKSVAKETAKKVNNSSNEITPTRLSNSRTEKSPPFITALDLNNPTLFQQSFTDNQQVQLRAQILVYGSLISGTSPEEPHMIAAFGQSDSGRKAWEAAWNACTERVHFQKSQINNHPNTPLQSRSNLKDSNQEIGSIKNKIPSIPTTTNPILSPIFPVSTPLWNMSTPQNQLQSTPIPKTALFDYRQTHSPLHSFQSQRPNPYGQWVASSPVPAFSPRFPSLPITESVKLTTVKESGGPATSITPLQHTSQIVLSGQPVTDSKTRKRKKVADTNTIQSPSPVAFSTPVSITPITNPFLSALSPVPTHGQPKPVDQTIEKTVTKEETMSKIEESKVQATEAAVQAANAVTHCQDIWSQLERQKNSNLISDNEAKLASCSVSIDAAASVAKMAAFAAKIASNVAEQARIMADEVIISSTKIASQPLNSDDHSSSVISVAKEAARRRIEAALAASKHAENLDAIVKAAELAAEAVSQAGKIAAVGNSLTIKELGEVGPEGNLKTPKVSNKQGYSGNKQKVEGDKMIDFGGTGKIEIDLSKAMGAVGQTHTSDADVDMAQSTSHSWKDNDIKEGCLVEVYKDDSKNKGAWFAANVLALKDGKAFVCYSEISSDDVQLKEWVPLEVEGREAPKIRVAHPMTALRFEGNKKRGRTVFSDCSWCSGDQVEVWVHDSWHEAVVVEMNKIDLTSLTVQFPAEGKTSVVRSWHVRSSLVWKDGKWIDWSCLKASHSSQGDTPQEKRQKFEKEKESIDLETMKHQESRIPLPSFSTQNISFDIGKSSTSIDDKKQKTRGPMRSGLQKERSRVVFGVPQPGKKQKFIDMSKHYVADGSSKNDNNNNNPPSNLVKKFSINDDKEKQVAEVKSKIPKFRKPPVPVLSQREKSKSSVSDKNVKDSVRVNERLPHQQNDVPLNTPKTDGLNKRKFPSGNGKASKVEEVKDILTSEAEPRRSNRKIQPTSRLLEGLQSQLSISKMPTVSHSSQRSHISKGSPRPG